MPCPAFPAVSAESDAVVPEEWSELPPHPTEATGLAKSSAKRKASDIKARFDRFGVHRCETFIYTTFR